MTTNTDALTAHADQLSAHLRDARCCDALAPCQSCQVGRMTVQVERHVALIPAQRVAESERVARWARRRPMRS